MSRAGWRRLGWGRRWLIASRAAVLPLTAMSVLFGGLLALPWTPGEGVRLLLATVTLLLAHATGNLLHDAVGWLGGRDRDGGFRRRYGAHPLADGLLGVAAFLLLLMATGALTLTLGLALCRQAGAPAYWLASAGAVLMLLYAWPLNGRGLGEAAVFLVWGPLMAGGTYWLLSGDWGDDIAIQTSIFGLGATAVVFAKHIDQRRDDAASGIRTLAVRLGPLWAPRCLAALAVGQVTAALIWAVHSSSWTYLLLLTVLPSLAAFVGVCLQRRPAARPKGFAVNRWPLWYSVAAFRFACASGLALLAAALVRGIG